MAGEGKGQDMRTKEINTLIFNLRLLALKIIHGTEKLIRRTKMEAEAERKKTF